MTKKVDLRTIHTYLVELQNFVVRQIEEVRRYPDSIPVHKRIAGNVIEKWSGIQTEIEEFFQETTLPTGYQESKDLAEMVYNHGKTPKITELGVLNEKLIILINYIFKMIKK